MRWVLLLVSILFSLILAELIARRVVPEVELQTGLREGGVLIPYLPGGRADLLTEEFRVHYEINDFGHRDRLDRRAERTPGVPRIALLGDSFSAGWGVEFADSFGARFERATGIEMVNTAKNGGCGLWYVPQARYLRKLFSPDWLLVQVFDNDPEDDGIWAKRFELAVGDRFRELPEDLRPDTSLHERLSEWWDSLLLRRRFRALKRRMEGEEIHSLPFVRTGAKPDFHVETRAEAIAKYGLVFGPETPFSASFTFHLPDHQDEWKERIAWDAQLMDQLLEEADAADVPVAVLYIPVYQVFLHEPLAPNPLSAAMREVSERHGALWLDAEEAFRALPRPWELYYAHDGHLNPEGHAAVAEILERELAPQVRATRMTGERAAM